MNAIAISEFLPDRLASPLNELSNAFGLNPETILMTLLGTASSLLKQSTQLAIKEIDFSVTSSLFVAIVGGSGEGKTLAVDKMARLPLEKLCQKEKNRQKVFYFTKTEGITPIIKQLARQSNGMLYLVNDIKRLPKEALNCSIGIVGGVYPGELKQLITRKDDLVINEWSRFIFVNQSINYARSFDDFSGNFVGETIDVLADLYQTIGSYSAVECQFSETAKDWFFEVYQECEAISEKSLCQFFKFIYNNEPERIAKLALNLHVIWCATNGVDAVPEKIEIEFLKLAIKLSDFITQQIEFL